MYCMLALVAAAALVTASPAQQPIKPGDIKDYNSAIEAMKSTNANDRAAGLSFLFILGKEAQVASHQVVTALNDPSKDVRDWAVKAIGRVNPELSGPVITLSQGSKNPEETAAALNKLAQMGNAASAAVPALLVYLQKSQGDDRATVVEVLSAVGGKDKSLAGVLANIALRDPDPRVRQAAMKALPRQESTQSAMELFAGILMKESDPNRRTAVIGVVAQVGKGNPQAIQLLQGVMKSDSSPAVRAAAQQALEKIQAK